MARLYSWVRLKFSWRNVTHELLKRNSRDIDDGNIELFSLTVIQRDLLELHTGIHYRLLVMIFPFQSSDS